jgi:hypothetical protein
LSGSKKLDDGRFLALLTLRASGRGSGARVETEYAQIITVCEGLRLHSLLMDTGRRRS